MITPVQDIEMDEGIAKLIENIENGSAIEKKELSQDMIDSLYNYAYHFYKSSKYAEAKSFFRFLTLININTAKYWMGLGASQQMLKDYDEAIASYKIAMVLNDQDPYVYFVIADCYILQGLTEKGLEVLDEAVKLFGTQDKYKKLIDHIDLIRQAWDNQKLEKING